MSTDLPTGLPEPTAAAPSATPGARSKPHARALTGVVVATALPYADDPAAPAGLRPDLDRYTEHCRWLVDSGCHGVGPNGSLGEYSSLTDAEWRAVVGRDALVVVGVHGVGTHQARRWAEHAAEDGADGVLCLSPTLYRANTAEVVHHFEQVAAVGLPVMVYNNPLDTKVDLTPEVIGELAAIDNVVAIKECSGDVRRVRHIRGVRPGPRRDRRRRRPRARIAADGRRGLVRRFSERLPRRVGTPIRPGPRGPARGGARAVRTAGGCLPLGLAHRVRPGRQAGDGPGRPVRRPVQAAAPLSGERLAALDADLRRAVDALAAADDTAGPQPCEPTFAGCQPGEPATAGPRQPAVPAAGAPLAGAR